MNKQAILGIVRHVLTFVGGLLVTRGLLNETLSQELVGGLVTLIGFVWSVVSKKPSEPVKE
jgi:hypothetical protein